MRVIIKDNKFLIIAESKSNYFDLPKKVCNNRNHVFDFITKCIEFLAEQQ